MPQWQLLFQSPVAVEVLIGKDGIGIDIQRLSPLEHLIQQEGRGGRRKDVVLEGLQCRQTILGETHAEWRFVPRTRHTVVRILGVRYR